MSRFFFSKSFSSLSLIVFFFSSLCFFVISSAKPNEASNSPVVILREQTFNSSVLHSNDGHRWFLKFYAPWCGHCKKLAPVFEELARELKVNHHQEKIRLGKIDCTVEKLLCSRFNIRGYPTLKLILNSSSVVDYRSSREPSALKKFLLEDYQSYDAVPLSASFSGEQGDSDSLKGFLKTLKETFGVHPAILIGGLSAVLMMVGLILCVVCFGTAEDENTESDNEEEEEEEKEEKEKSTKKSDSKEQKENKNNKNDSDDANVKPEESKKND